MADLIRTVRFKPYRKGMGPTFTLRLYDCHTPYRGGPQWQVGYSLKMHDRGKTIEIFAGDNYGCSPLHAIDSDEAVEAIMSFLTLRPGDVDPDYFEDYTNVQLAFVSYHAEALGIETQCRFVKDA